MKYLEIVKKLWKDKTNRHILIVSSISILLILILKNRFDYAEYEKQWAFFLDEGNSGDYANPYGPFHNIIAYLYLISSKFPRLLFSLLALVASIFLIKKINASSLDDRTKTKSFYLLLYNPIIWIMFVVNGCNDGLIGFLFLFGVVCYDDKKYVLSALMLSLAILYKYIPIFILPVLFINNRKINWKFSFSSLVFLGIGFGTSFFIWGEKFFSSLFIHSDRESKILSIFRYLRGDYSFLKLFGIENVDYLSLYFVFASVILVFILHLIYNWHWLVSLIITLLSVHLFYLVGHFQFLISVYLLLFFYIYKFADSENIHQFKKTFFVIYWMAGTTLLYGITEGFYRHFEIIRDFIGLPHFIIILLTIIAIIPNRNGIGKAYR